MTLYCSGIMKINENPIFSMTVYLQLVNQFCIDCIEQVTHRSSFIKIYKWVGILETLETEIRKSSSKQVKLSHL